MSISPVSFGSVMVFTIKDGKPKAPTQALIRTTFQNNPGLSKYNLSDTATFKKDKIDGTVYNAAPDFCEMLDRKHRYMNKNSVVLTEADFFVNPKDTEKRYFITAATEEDELWIQKVLGQGLTMFVAKFGDKYL